MTPQPDIEREADDEFMEELGIFHRAELMKAVMEQNCPDPNVFEGKIKSFLREKTVSKSSLKVALTKLRKELRDKHKNDGWADHELPDVHYNSALDDLSKELNLDGV